MADAVEFETWQAICEGKARYCRALDSKDWAQFGDLFTEDFVLDVSDGTDLLPINGRDEAIARIRSSIEQAITVHQVHSPEMGRAGDSIDVIWAMQDRVIWGPDRPSLVGYGHYHERWVKQGTQWKIAALKLSRLHLDIIPPTGEANL